MRLSRGFARKSLILIVACFACFPAATASAEYIQFTFTGEVTEIGGALWDPWLDTQLGDPVTVQYVFDSNAEDHSGSSQSGAYAFMSLTFTIGDSLQAASSGAIWVDNDTSYWGDDQYAVVYNLSDVDSGAFSFRGYDMFSSDALPTDLDWTQYATEHQGMIGLPSDSSRYIRYQFSSWDAVVVPGAPTFVVLLFGVSRKRRRVSLSEKTFISKGSGGFDEN